MNKYTFDLIVSNLGAQVYPEIPRIHQVNECVCRENDAKRRTYLS